MFEWWERLVFFRVRPHAAKVRVKVIRAGDWIKWKGIWNRVSETHHDVTVVFEGGEAVNLKDFSSLEIKHLVPDTGSPRLITLLFSTIGAIGGLIGIAGAVAQLFAHR